MLNWKEPSIYFEAIIKVRLLLTSKNTKLNRSTSQQTQPFPIWTENSALLHRKRQNSYVPHPNRLFPIWTENGFWSSFVWFRTRRCYIEKDKTDPAYTTARDLHRERKERRDWLIIENDKTESFPIPAERSFISKVSQKLDEQRTRRCYNQKTRLNRSPPSRLNCFPSEQWTRRCYIEKDRRPSSRKKRSKSLIDHRQLHYRNQKQISKSVWQTTYTNRMRLQS